MDDVFVSLMMCFAIQSLFFCHLVRQHGPGDGCDTLLSFIPLDQLLGAFLCTCKTEIPHLNTRQLAVLDD